jgi:adenylate cyclase
MSEGERRLAAIMFTDIVGYTRLTQANEALALELLEEHRRLLRPLFPTHGGTEVKTIGDAFLVEFKSALEAVLCAVDIQKSVNERNSRVTGQRRLELRVGVHAGDVVHGPGDVYGDAVNVASRIEPLAEPGGVCVSQQVYDSIRNKSQLTLEKMGEVELKNVELPVGVYKVIMPWSETPKDTAQAPRERLAVLPFVNISPDPNDEYFADGLTEELISKLSEISNLKVIARTSVMNYKRKEKNISQIGRELGVGSVIEGSVRKAGTKIRVAVQLIDARTEEHLWASNYDKELDDIFAIQSDVASRVAGSISKGVFPMAPKKDTEDAEAYTFFIRAMQLYHEGTEPALREAVTCFDHALSRDPAFARAYAGLSFAWGTIAVNGYEDFSVVHEKALVAARKALELRPDLAEAHSAMADVHQLLDRFDESVLEAKKAIEINPNLAAAHLTLGIVESSQGRLDLGLESCRMAYELDPLSLHAGNLYALVCRVSGKESEALAVLERMNELNPRNARVYSGLAEYYMLKRDFPRAQEMLDKGLMINPKEPLLRLNQGLLYAFTGRRKEAEDSLREMETDKAEAVRLFGQLFIQAALGNLDAAFIALERQAELHSWPFLVKSLPVFEGLRKDPRFIGFCREVGLTP